MKYVQPARGRVRRSGTAVTYAALAPRVEYVASAPRRVAHGSSFVCNSVALDVLCAAFLMQFLPVARRLCLFYILTDRAVCRGRRRACGDTHKSCSVVRSFQIPLLAPFAHPSCQRLQKKKIRYPSSIAQGVHEVNLCVHVTCSVDLLPCVSRSPELPNCQCINNSSS